MNSSIIRRMAGYPLIYIASTYFIYFLVSAGIYPYIGDSAEKFAAAGLMNGIYLKVLYSILCLLVAMVAEFILIGKPHGNELRLYSIFNLAYFGVLSCCSIALLIYAVVHSAPLFLITTIAPIIICLCQVVLAVFRLLQALKEVKAEEEAAKTAIKQ